MASSNKWHNGGLLMRQGKNSERRILQIVSIRSKWWEALFNYLITADSQKRTNPTLWGAGQWNFDHQITASHVYCIGERLSTLIAGTSEIREPAITESFTANILHGAQLRTN